MTRAFELGFKLGVVKAAAEDEERGALRKYLFPEQELRLKTPGERALSGVGMAPLGAVGGGVAGGLAGLSLTPESVRVALQAGGPAAERSLIKHLLRSAGKGALIGTPLLAALGTMPQQGFFSRPDKGEPGPTAL